MHEARLYSPINGSKFAVHCRLCAHNCRILPGKRGLCQVRLNEQGTLRTLVYGRLVSENIDPIEKKPLFHFLPGSQSYSIATAGCNFRCRHCQNHLISQYPAAHQGKIPGAQRSPGEVVNTAKRSGASSISYTYVEPTIFYEFVLDTARLAKEHGLANVFVSNGYTSSAATREIAPVLDANNIDLKSFSDSFYREICGAGLKPVLDTIVLMKELKVWVEITTLIIPGLNDSVGELTEIARFIHSVDPGIPWHVSRFHPGFKIVDRPMTPVGTIRRARDIGRGIGLKYVYTGNIPGEEGENTFCDNCGSTVIRRSGFQIDTRGLSQNRCLACGSPLDGIFL